MKPKSIKGMSPTIIVLIVIAIIALGAAAFAVSQNASQMTPSSTKTASNSGQPTTEAQYKDGTYNATGSYGTPGGRESITVSVTLQEGEITDTKLTQNARTGQAKEFQQKFASGYRESVVGKKIESVSLTRIAGSSLTSTGFNNALEQIKEDAAA